MGASKEIFMQQREAEMNNEESFHPTSQNTFTKHSQIELADRLTADVNEGNKNPLHVYIRFRHLQIALDIALERIKPSAIEEGQKLSKGGDKIMGVNVSVMPGKRNFDYSNDEVWNELKEKMKKQEMFLKGLSKPMSDMEGVISNPPLITYYGDTLNLKFE